MGKKIFRKTSLLFLFTFVSFDFVVPISFSSQRMRNKKPLTRVKTLKEALEVSYLQNPDLEAARTNFKVAIEGLAQAQAAWTPSINLTGTQKFNGSHNRYESGSSDKIVQRYGEEGRSNNLSLGLSQNLYAGGGTLAQQRNAKAILESAFHSLIDQEQKVFLEVVQAYVKTALAQKILIVEKKNEANLRELMKHTRVRYQVGDQRRSDLATVQARLAAAVVNVARAEADLIGARATLQNVIGDIPLDSQLVVPSHYHNNPRTLSLLKEISLKNNPSLLSDLRKVEAARHNTSYKFSSLLPSVDLTASIGPSSSLTRNRYQQRDLYPSTRNSSYKKEAQVSLNVTIPLFTGGASQSQYRQAELSLRKARLEWSNMKRKIEAQCKTYFSLFEAAQQNVISSKVALDENQIALNSGKKEYELGLISLMDMVYIEDNWINAYRQFLSVLSELVTSSYQVLQMTGHLTASHLKLDVPFFDRTQYNYDNNFLKSWFSLGKRQEKTSLYLNGK